MKSELALLELSVINAETAGLKFEDVVVEGLQEGVLPEVLTRLRWLWNETRTVAGEVIHIGRIIVQRIFAFLKAHRHLPIAMALGAAVAYLAAHSIPLVGAMLAPTAALFGGLYVAGVSQVRHDGGNSLSPVDAAIALAAQFFKLLLEIVDGAAQYLGQEE